MDKEATLRIGEVRITVPLFGTKFEGLSHGARKQITDTIWLASLDDKEQERTKRSARVAALSRFEFFGVAPDFDPAAFRRNEHASEQFAYSVENDALGQRVLRQVDLLALTARLHPNHQSALADVWVGEHWRRVAPIHFAWSPVGNYSYFPAGRMGTFRSLLANWPANPGKKLTLAYSYYLDSIAERQRGSLAKSLTAAAIAAEIILDSPRTELKRTFRQRGTHLVATGSDCKHVDRRLSRLYDLRSKVVHRGNLPDITDVHSAQHWLMAALPAVAAAQSSTSHDDLLRALDAACYDPQEIAWLHDPRSWWRYVDYSALCRRDAD